MLHVKMDINNQSNPRPTTHRENPIELTQFMYLLLHVQWYKTTPNTNQYRLTQTILHLSYIFIHIYQ